MSKNLEIAVVLGSGLKTDGSATPVTELRAKAAAAFIACQPMKLILSGSRPPDDPGTHGCTEASVMAEIVRAELATRQDAASEPELLLEDQSFDTFGNAIFTVARYLKNEEPGTLYVITSPFHMERAVYIFEQVLGKKWTVVARESPEWEGETRQPGAPAAMERARAFFSDIEPGDLSACEKKLVARIPAYRDRGLAA